MTKEKRVDLLNALSELEVPPYNSERYATDALLASMRLRRGDDVWPPAMSLDAITPSRHRATQESHSSERARAGAASSAKMGRPANPTVDVDVYVYAEVCGSFPTSSALC